MSEWRDWLPDFHRAGSVTVAFIGIGSVEQASEVKRELLWPSDLFVDPYFYTYHTFHFANSISSTFNRPSIKHFLEATRKGHRQTWTRFPIHGFQQGGFILIDQRGDIILFHKERFAGHQLQRGILIQAVRRAQRFSYGTADLCPDIVCKVWAEIMSWCAAPSSNIPGDEDEV